MVSLSKKATKRAILSFPLIALVLIFVSDNGKDYLRRLATHCISNIYANDQEILKIPDVPDASGTYIPSYIAICQTWLNEEVHGNARRLDDSSQKQVNRIAESDGTCKDWSSPHASMMDVVSSLIVTRFCKSSKYRHNCDRVRVYDEDSIGFDHSTIQQALSTPTLGHDDTLGNEAFVKNQCRRALMYFDPQVESARVGAKAHHHCFAWPDSPSKNTDVNSIPNLPNAAHVSPLSMVIQPLVQRYYHAAVQWRDVTDKPPQEENSGVVIYLDQQTLGVNYTTYLNYIPASASSITVLSGPLCATAYLKTGQLCKDYGQGLANFIAQIFRTLTTTGFKNGPGVVFQIAASTAGISSRVALSHLAICPPHTTSCYLPALSRVAGSSIVLEDPNWGKAIDFFTVTGHHGRVNVIVMDKASIPPLQDVSAHEDPRLLGASKKFTQVNALVDHNGYPRTMTVPTMPTDDEVSRTSDDEIRTRINRKIGDFSSNPHVKPFVTEHIPSNEMVIEAVSKHKPLDINVRLGDGWNANGRHGELGLDSDVGLGKTVYDAPYIASVNGYRADSISRIKKDYEEESNHKRRTGGGSGKDPNNIFEIKCPEGSSHSAHEKFGGQSEGVGRRQRRMVAVDARTFKFGESLTKICADAA